MSASHPMVLVVDDDESCRVMVQQWLEMDGFAVETATGGQQARRMLTDHLPDVVCLDLQMPDVSGLTLLTEVVAIDQRLPVIMVTTDTQPSTVVESMRRGAFDYVTKPIDRSKLQRKVRTAADQHRRSERGTDSSGYYGIIGSSGVMTTLFNLIERVSASDVTVFIHGESGSGKELVAHAIHVRSSRSPGPYVAINCAAIPENLMESEMFGHEKGAFTGAVQRRIGRFEEAHRGTLFLDEVAELPLHMQAKLLRVLETHSFYRVGGEEPICSDFRLVVATHRDLEAAVADGRFREDLFYRLAVFEVECPTLRERGDDILALAHHFIRIDGPDLTLTSAAEELLLQYSWPGNVRELRNAIQRAVVASRSASIDRDDFPPRIRYALAKVRRSVEASPQAAPLSLAEVEQRAILAAWQRHDGDIGQMVASLGIGRTTLYRRLKKYGLT